MENDWTPCIDHAGSNRLPARSNTRPTCTHYVNIGPCFLWYSYRGSLLSQRACLSGVDTKTSQPARHHDIRPWCWLSTSMVL
eukprot:7820150-Pyramimonas_sp.AAC.1